MSLPWFWKARIVLWPKIIWPVAKCFFCYSSSDFMHLKHHSCTEEGRQWYWRNMYHKEPPLREDDADYCSGISILCNPCHNKLTTQEQFQVYSLFVNTYWEGAAITRWPDIAQAIIRNSAK